MCLAFCGEKLQKGPPPPKKKIPVEQATRIMWLCAQFLQAFVEKLLQPPPPRKQKKILVEQATRLNQKNYLCRNKLENQTELDDTHQDL